MHFLAAVGEEPFRHVFFPKVLPRMLPRMFSSKVILIFFENPEIHVASFLHVTDQKFPGIKLNLAVADQMLHVT